jgi:hypothetical protein
MGYHIEIDLALTGASFNRTATVNAANYRRYRNGKKEVVIVSASDDINTTPTKLTDGSCPVGYNVDRDGYLYLMLERGLHAGEGAAPLPVQQQFPGIKAVGTATMAINVGGTFRIVPNEGTTPVDKVKVLARGMIDGFIGLDPHPFTAPPVASFSQAIFIDGLGTALATAGTTATSSATVGVTGTVSGQPGVTAQIQGSSQVATSGTVPQNFFLLGKLPVNTPIVWNVSLTLQATNAATALGGGSAAWSDFTEGYVVVIPEPAGGGPTDPFYSTIRCGYNADSGLLGVTHPLIFAGAIPGLGVINDDGTSGPPLVNDYSGFLPEVELILADGAVPNDALHGALMQFSFFQRQETNPDGSIPFSNGTVDFLDPNNRANVLARADVTEVIAYPSVPQLFAELGNFTLVNLAPGSSPLADAFTIAGGAIDFDANIIALSDNFSQTATTTLPFQMVGGPFA